MSDQKNPTVSVVINAPPVEQKVVSGSVNPDDLIPILALCGVCGKNYMKQLIVMCMKLTEL